MRRITTALVTLVGVPTLLVSAVLTGPATAESTLLRDGASDVYKHQVTDPWVPAPTVSAGDVLRTRVTHRGKTVTVRSVYASLRRKGQYAAYDLIVANRAGKQLEFVLETSPGHWRGTMRAFHPNGTEARCGAEHAIDYAHETVTVQVPRGCLGDPHRVRARVLSWWADDDSNFYTDNPHNHSAEVDTWSGWVIHTRRSGTGKRSQA